MSKKLTKTHVSIKTEYFIILALALLIIPFWWIMAWIIASVFHEICHYAALRLSGCRIFRVNIGPNGTVMDTDLSGDHKEILCALAGPVGGLLLILIGRWFPRVAICGLFQSAYNLIPIYPLDGGRVVQCVLHKLFPKSTASQIEKWLEMGILILFVLLGLYAAFCLKLGLIPLVFAVILVIKNKQENVLAKNALWE
ncbi:MAG: M50 family metallopeptidase [Oscillospiraceae bacterium]|nr:M50 family metallopeptidase [Oscillospiraceae bacterium]